MKTVKTSTLYRSAEFDRAALDEENRTVELSFSSELPVERFFGYEVLDHKKSSVDLSRMKAGAPLLVEHDRADQVGVIEKAWVDEGNRVGRAVVRFGNSARANEVFQDVKDGIRRLVSVGYRVLRMVTEKVENDVETLRAVAWMPMEVSIVSVPADHTVGIGRANEADGVETVIIDQENRKMSDTTNTASTGAVASAAPTVDVEVLRSETRKIVAEQNKEILSITESLEKRYPAVRELSQRALAGDMDLATFRKAAFEVVKSDAKPLDLATRSQNINMPERDIKKYSFQRALVMAAKGKHEGLEKDCHEAACRQYNITPRGENSIIVPFDVLNYSARGQLAGDASLGGSVVETALLASSFIDILRTRMMVARLGATMLEGLVGNVTIPRQSAASSATWATSEAASIAATSVTFNQLSLTPKQVQVEVDYSWLLLNQSTPAVDALIRSDFQNVIARSIDLAALHGVGSSGQPTGVAATSGIGSVTGGAHGAAPTWANIVSLESAVANSNADIGALAYLTNSRVRGKLKQTLKGGSTATDGIYVWPDGPHIDGFQTLAGYRAGVSNQVSNTLTKGTSTTVCSAIFFGNWADLIVAMWSGLELLTDPYSGAATRTIKAYAYQAVDVGVRHAESFAAMLDATTT